MHKNTMILLILSFVCFGRIQTITDTLRTKAVKLSNTGFDSLMYVDVNDSTLKPSCIYYNKISKYTYFPAGIVFDTAGNDVLSITANQQPGYKPIVIRPSTTNDAGEIILYPMIADTAYDGAWINRISTGGVRIGAQIRSSENKNELIIGEDGFHFVNRLYGDPENPGFIKFETSGSTGPNIYVSDTTGITGSIAIYGDYHNTRGARFGFSGTHIYDSLFLHGIEEDLTSDTVDILFMKYGYEVKRRSLDDFADTIIKIIEAVDTVHVDSARASWKADTLITLSDSLDIVRGLISAASDSVAKSHHAVYADTADTAFVAGIADSAKNVSDTVNARINGTSGYYAQFNGTGHGVTTGNWYDNGSLMSTTLNVFTPQSISVGEDVIANKVIAPKIKPKGADTVSTGDYTYIEKVSDTSMCRVTLANIRTLMGAIGGTGTDNYLLKWNGTTAVENSIMYDDGTKIGIGTNAPNNILHVKEGASGATPYTTKGVLFESGNQPYLSFLSPDVNSAIINFGCPSDSRMAKITAFFNAGDKYMAFAVGNNYERMRITEAGIGIGTTTPAAPLDVNGKTKVSDTLFAKHQDLEYPFDSVKTELRMYLFDDENIEMYRLTDQTYYEGKAWISCFGVYGTITGTPTLRFSSIGNESHDMVDTIHFTFIYIKGGDIPRLGFAYNASADVNKFKLYDAAGASLSACGTLEIKRIHFTYMWE